MLFIILFLHQTTTCASNSFNAGSLFIILFLHQTTTRAAPPQFLQGCLSSCSYIKPQPRPRNITYLCVVYHLVPTSNHNWLPAVLSVWVVVYHLVPTSNHNWRILWLIAYKLFIILFLHQTTTNVIRHQQNEMLFIILFLHQTTTAWQKEDRCGQLFIILFLHQTTTLWWCRILCEPLFIILFLHQTTTGVERSPVNGLLFIILFLHQTTTINLSESAISSCLSSCSYIKPQLVGLQRNSRAVVYHLVPTSNHNQDIYNVRDYTVVYHLVPTSNHNITRRLLYSWMLFIILFLHQTTTRW